MVPYWGAMAVVGHCENPTLIVWRHIGLEGGSVRTISRVGVWVEKPGYDECKYSHDVSGERALQREDVIETKPSIESLVEKFVKTLRLEDSRGHPEKHV